MSYREYLQIFHPLNIEAFLHVLTTEFGAWENPHEPESFVIDDPPLPFYKPKQLEKHVSILGFNKTPLSHLLIVALIDHPEIAPPATIVRWMAEQEIVTWGTLEDLAWQFTFASRDEAGW